MSSSRLLCGLLVWQYVAAASETCQWTASNDATKTVDLCDLSGQSFQYISSDEQSDWQQWWWLVTLNVDSGDSRYCCGCQNYGFIEGFSFISRNLSTDECEGFAQFDPAEDPVYLDSHFSFVYSNGSWDSSYECSREITLNLHCGPQSNEFPDFFVNETDFCHPVYSATLQAGCPVNSTEHSSEVDIYDDLGMGFVCANVDAMPPLYVILLLIVLDLLNGYLIFRWDRRSTCRSNGYCTECCSCHCCCSGCCCSSDSNHSSDSSFCSWLQTGLRFFQFVQMTYILTLDISHIVSKILGPLKHQRLWVRYTCYVETLLFSSNYVNIITNIGWVFLVKKESERNCFDKLISIETFIITMGHVPMILTHLMPGYILFLPLWIIGLCVVVWLKPKLVCFVNCLCCYRRSKYNDRRVMQNPGTPLGLRLLRDNLETMAQPTTIEGHRQFMKDGKEDEPTLLGRGLFNQPMQVSPNWPELTIGSAKNDPSKEDGMKDGTLPFLIGALMKGDSEQEKDHDGSYVAVTVNHETSNELGSRDSVESEDEVIALKPGMMALNTDEFRVPTEMTPSRRQSILDGLNRTLQSLIRGKEKTMAELHSELTSQLLFGSLGVLLLLCSATMMLHFYSTQRYMASLEAVFTERKTWNYYRYMFGTFFHVLRTVAWLGNA